MQTATVFFRWVVRLAGLAQIVLGALFWTHHALSLVPVHMIVGMVVVLGLWALAFLAARAGRRPGFVALAVAWGFVLPIVGTTHGRLLVGPLHWVIQIVHLLLGIGALRLAEELAARVLQRAGRRSSLGARRTPPATAAAALAVTRTEIRDGAAADVEADQIAYLLCVRHM